MSLPAVNTANIPATPKRRDDDAPVQWHDQPGADDDAETDDDAEEVAEPSPTGSQAQTPAADPPADRPSTAPDPAPSPVAEVAPDEVTDGSPREMMKVNTTAFPFWPDQRAPKHSLPEDDSDGQKWLEVGIVYPEKEEADKRWHGVHLLGQGLTGRVGMWIRVDENNIIDHVRKYHPFSRCSS